MDTLTTVSPVAAVLALAEVLGFDLPVPCNISFSPWVLDRPSAAFALQFRGPDQLDSLHAWAARYGVTVEMPGPGQSFAHVYFTHSGVRFQCYAELRPDES